MGVYCYLCFTTNKQKQKLPYVHSARQRYDNFGNSPPSLNRKTWFYMQSKHCRRNQLHLVQVETGIQWHQLPVTALFGDVVLRHKTVLYWCSSSLSPFLSFAADRLEFSCPDTEVVWTFMKFKICLYFWGAIGPWRECRELHDRWNGKKRSKRKAKIEFRRTLTLNYIFVIKVQTTS